MTLTAPRSRWMFETFAALALAGLFATALHQSWGMWLNPIIDTGRDLYISEQLSEGGFKLYRDIDYIFPPLAPYLLAVITSVLGSNLTIMTWLGVSVSMGLILLLYLIGRRWSGTVGAMALVFLFITIHLTGHTGYSFNFIFPYSHAAVFGFLFLLLFLYALMRYAVEEGSTGWLVLALVAGSAAGWSKIEFAATFLVLSAASVLIRKPPVIPVVAAALGNLALLGLLSWYFSDAPPERHWLTMNILPQSLLSGEVAKDYYDRHQGLDQPLLNLMTSAWGAALISGSVACLWAIERLKIARRHAATVSIISLFVLLQIALAQNFVFYRGWVILQWLLIPIAIKERNRSPLLLPLLLSVLLGARILLRLEPTFYGFLYAIPAEILFIYLLFGEFPRRRFYSTRMATAWLPLIVILGAHSLLSQREAYRPQPENVVSTTRGKFQDREADRAELLKGLFRLLESRQPESMVVIPEGLTLNWLADVKTSIPYHTFNPAELPPGRAQEVIIPTLEQNLPELILLIRRDYPEYGYIGIGVDYGQELIERIECLYEPVIYRQNEGFFMVVMERKRDSNCL